MIREHFLDGKAVRALLPSKRPLKVSDLPCRTDRPETRDPTRGAPAQHAVFRRRIGTTLNCGFNAGLLFQIWKGG
jgi:hypothetical protein